MRLEQNDERFTHVVLSKRNLLSLLHKVEWEESFRTITYTTKDRRLLIVSVEPDEEHYAHPERDIPYPGPMHHATETTIAGVCGATDPRGICYLPFGHTGDCLMRRDDA